MDFNFKKQGQRHYKNKARFKDKSKVSKATPQKFSTEPASNLGSNWNRYEEDVENEETPYYATDFSVLAGAPISQGGHFQFKSDKNFECDNDLESIQKNGMFNLDLDILQNSIRVIPFHRRCGLDESVLTPCQLEEMNKRAHQNKIQYEHYLKLHSLAKEFSSRSISNIDSRSTEEEEEVLQQPSENVIKQGVSDVTESDSNVPNKPVVKGDKEELEEWLDDILDN